MDAIQKYGDERGRPYSQSSLDLYDRYLKKLNGNKSPKNNKFLKNPKIIKSKIDLFKNKNNEPITNNTRKSIYVAVITFLRSVNDNKEETKKLIHSYDKIIQSYVELYDYSKEDLSISEMNNWCDKQTLLLGLKTLMEGNDGFNNCIKKIRFNTRDIEKAQRAVILSCYLLHSVKRGDWANVKVIKKTEDTSDTKNFKCNFYMLGTKELILNKYKTARYYGSQTEQIKDDLAHILYTWTTSPMYRAIQETSVSTSNGYLFYSFNNKKSVWGIMQKHGITRIIPSIFKSISKKLIKLEKDNPFEDKHITINLLRRIMATEELTHEEKQAVFKAQKLAKGQNHSLITHLNKYHRS